MILHRRRDGDRPSSLQAVFGWQLWSVPPAARTFLLLAELVAVTATAVLLAREPATSSILIRLGVLAALSIGYSEVGAHSTRMQRYLGSDKAFTNPMSVWSYAAVLTVPAGWAAAFIAIQYAHAVWQRRRDHAGRSYRVMFTAGATMLAQLATAGLVDAGGSQGGLHGHVLASLAALVGVGVFLAVNMLVLLPGMWLAIRPPSIRALIPDTDTLGYEVGTLLLGIAAAEFLLHSPLLLPATLVLVVLLHRSSIAKALQHAARTDAKTGLLTAAAWTETARSTLSRAARGGSVVAVLLIDLDWFKRINDTHGHLTGDRVLAAVAGCLRHELRDHDGLGRFGGEELVAILEGTTLTEATAVANRLREAISRLRVDDNVTVTASIGLAHIARLSAGASVDALLESADVALYEAKQAGRNRVSVTSLAHSST